MRMFVFLLILLLPLAIMAVRSADEPSSAEELGGNRVTQIGLVVHDIEATAEAYSELLGVDVPDVIITDELEKAHTQYPSCLA